MVRPVAGAVFVVGALLALAASVLAFTPLLDGPALVSFNTYSHVLANGTHHGPGRCLRYNPYRVLQTADVAATLVYGGVGSKRLKELFPELAARTFSAETAAHQEEEADERLTWAAHQGVSSRLLVMLKRPRLRRVLRERVAWPVVPQVAGAAPMTSDEQKVLDPIWRAHPELFTGGALEPLLKGMRYRETVRTLEALAEWVNRHQTIDETAMPAELLVDGWGRRVMINVIGSEVHLVSYGADGAPGGFSEESDIIRTADLP